MKKIAFLASFGAGLEYYDFIIYDLITNFIGQLFFPSFNTDKEPALYPAIKNVFGNATKHRNSKYKNNVIEQNHRWIKSRCRVMKGFKNIFCALKFCTAFEEIRQFFRLKNKTRAKRRRIIAPKIISFNNLFTAAV